MSEPISNSKRVVKNTLLLSVRMVLVMLVSLYTVRVILETLGIVDYGIYNVVGGAVLVFSFLTQTMTHATQRFFSFELGDKNCDSLKEIFQINLTIYIMILMVVVLLSSTIGAWFLNTQMVIPESRMAAANWIYVFMILSFVVRMLSAPYQAILISREKMTLFAWFSVIEVVFLLIIVYLLQVLPFDKLKCYAVLNFAVTLIISFSYGMICRYKFKECRFGITLNGKKLRKVMSYTGWSFYGHSATALRNYGVNILLNLFFGPVINTARGIAYQAHNAVNSFVANFTIALKPQIVKNYAAGHHEDMVTQIIRGSKISYYIMLLLTTPIMLQTSYIFTLWLKNVPDYTVLFTRLVLGTAIIDAITIPLMAAIEATGNIKKYQLIIGTMLYAIIPVSWLLLKAGAPPETPMWVSIIISLLMLSVKIQLAYKSYRLPVKRYYLEVLGNIGFVTVIAYSIPSAFILLIKSSDGFLNFIAVSAICIISVCATIYLVGINSTERKAINKFIQSKFPKINTVSR